MNTADNLAPNWSEFTSAKHTRLAALMGRTFSLSEFAVDSGLSVYRWLLADEERGELHDPTRREALALIRELGGLWAGHGANLTLTALMLDAHPDVQRMLELAPMTVCRWYTLDEVTTIIEDTSRPLALAHA